MCTLQQTRDMKVEELTVSLHVRGWCGYTDLGGSEGHGPPENFGIFEMRRVFLGYCDVQFSSITVS